MDKIKAVVSYARRYADRAEKSGRGTEFPTVRQAAKRFGCSQEEIVTRVEDAADMGVDGFVYIGLSVGCQIAGSGYAEYGAVGDYEIEAYRAGTTEIAEKPPDCGNKHPTP